jgi:hypothetical protein
VIRMVDQRFGGTRSVRAFNKRSPQAFTLAGLVFFFVVYGPAGCSPSSVVERGWYPFALFLLAVALQLAYFLQRSFNAMTTVHLLLVGCLAFAVCAFGAEQEAHPGLYRHWYAPLAASVMLVAWTIQVVRRLNLFTLELGALSASMNAEELSKPPEEVQWNKWDFLRAAPIAWLLIAAANYDRNRDAFVRFIDSTFLSGGALLVTFCVIALAGARLLGVSYVTTVLDAGSAVTIFSYLLAAYALLWLYDFWMHQAPDAHRIDGCTFGTQPPSAERHPHRSRAHLLVDSHDPPTCGAVRTALVVRTFASSRREPRHAGRANHDRRSFGRAGALQIGRTASERRAHTGDSPSRIRRRNASSPLYGGSVARFAPIGRPGPCAGCQRRLWR